ncbi:phosphatidate cytidylyltransferase [Georgenia sp. TF02-10]|uniref:phosphatidate cytidylyltransferase n=1 Tax=Georgenia sp. TF02-10 TaxID=2917725 RepID=UPI001FA7B16C|nr:phosphatidate cytidylyltransferase [Georgenia sp. TF02-10]UNX55907.1 phosphatidate cytidylyltransferase [Georgenia sp. TF02-10]
MTAPPDPPEPLPGAVQRLREARRRARSALVEPAPPTPRDPVPPPGRAGRNLPAAVGVGLVLLALVAATLFVRREAFVALVVLATGGALWELARAVAQRGIAVPLPPLWVGAVGIAVAAWVGGAPAMLMAFVLTAGGVFLWRVLDGGGLAAVRDAAAGIFAAAYVPYLAGFAVLLLRMEDGAWLVATFLLVAIANDTGGYAAGVLLGRTPMAPSISPKKSWEGLAGSVLLAAAVGVVLTTAALALPWWVGAGLGVAAVAAATTGDLAESLLKRDLGLKDMGSLLPGHGGIMDRLDSMLASAPVCYVILGAATGGLTF